MTTSYRQLSACLALLLGLVALLGTAPLAHAEPAAPDPAAAAEDVEEAEGELAAEEPVDEPVAEPVDEPVAPEADEPSSAPADEDLDAAEDAPDAAPAEEDTEPEPHGEADPQAESADEAAPEPQDAPAAATSETDVTAAVAARGAPELVVTTFPLDVLCALLDAFPSDEPPLPGEGDIGLEVPDGVPLAPATRAALVGQLERLLETSPDAFALNASYDGETLFVLVLPDPRQCPGFDWPEWPGGDEDVALPELVVLTEEDICAELDDDIDDGFDDGFDDDIDLTDPDFDLLPDFEDLEPRLREDLSPEEQALYDDLAAQLADLLAAHPGTDVADVYFDRTGTLFIVLAPAVVECDDEVDDGGAVVTPISRQPAPQQPGPSAPAAQPRQLARTGAGTAVALAAGLALLLGGGLALRAGRRRRTA